MQTFELTDRRFNLLLLRNMQFCKINIADSLPALGGVRRMFISATHGERNPSVRGGGQMWLLFTHSADVLMIL